MVLKVSTRFLQNISISAFLFFLSVSFAEATISVVKEEVRDVSGNYGTFNKNDPDFGKNGSVFVDIYPGNGSGDFRFVESVVIELHDHNTTSKYDLTVHTLDGGSSTIVTHGDIHTYGASDLCGDESSMFGLYAHPHDDSACYRVTSGRAEGAAINAVIDKVTLRLYCSSGKCSANPNTHYHIRYITWNFGECRYQGIKFLEPGRLQTDPLISTQTVYLNGGEQTSSAQPYSFNVIAGSTNTISTNVPSGYEVYSTTCVNDVSCHDESSARTNAASKTIACPPEGDRFVDLWWHFAGQPTPTPSDTPTLTPSATATPTPTSTPIPVPPAACWINCTTENETQAGLRCLTLGGQQLWRNELCPIDGDCLCDPTNTPTPTPIGNALFCPV